MPGAFQFLNTAVGHFNLYAVFKGGDLVFQFGLQCAELVKLFECLADFVVTHLFGVSLRFICLWAFLALLTVIIIQENLNKVKGILTISYIKFMLSLTKIRISCIIPSIERGRCYDRTAKDKNGACV